MKFLKLISLACVLLLSGSLATRAQKALLKVITYNIRSIEPDFNVNPHIRLIKEQQPDIVFYQEVESRTSRMNERDLIQEIANGTGMFNLFGRSYNKDGTANGEYGNAILSRYPIISSEVVQLPRLKAEGAADPRTALIADILMPDNTRVRVVSVHLDHMPGNGTIQLQQAKLLAGNQVLENNTPMVIAGDFNSDPSSDAISMLSTYFDKQGGYINTFTNGGQLDYIFTYPKGKWSGQDITILQPKMADNKQDLSDHYPLKATLKLSM